ncbi:MAG TPA: histidinol-phosphate transaminase [Candidatus Acidoferrales bacterium]|nr:histidinol-phosphate transaminase [Candidatus Acidoferrales bacterium]
MRSSSITGKLSRRQFAGRVGAAVGAVLVAPEILRSVADARQPRGAEDAVQLNANENPYGPSEKARAAMTRSQAVAARYPDSMESQMVEAIAKLHGVEPANVVLGCGSGEILRMADMAFLGPGKNVVVAEPTFEAVLQYAKVARGEGIKVPLTSDYRHDLPAMAAACNASTALVYVCNPNNPTGTIVTREELATFIARVPKSTLLMVDEAYHHFVEDSKYASTFDWIGKAPNLIVVRTFSKIYGMAGMRLGYAVGSKENIAAMRAHATASNSNAAVLEAALASLADSAHVPKYKKMMNDTRRWLCAELQKDGRRYIPSETNFVMIDLKGDVGPVIQAFRKKNILVGRKFPSLPNWLRISVGSPKEMETFMAGLREIVPVAAAKAA